MTDKRKVIAGLLVLILAGIGLVGGTFLVRQRLEIRRQAAPATTIYFDPSTVNTSLGQTVNFDIKLDTGTNYISYLQLDISYDSTILQAASLSFDGTVLPVNIDPVDLSQSGIIFGSAGTLPGGNPVHGTGVTVALVSFNVIGSASTGTSINFGDNTLAYTADPEETPTGVNLITSKVSATVSTGIAEEDVCVLEFIVPTVTPTPTPTITLTPTPTPTITLTPTPTPTITLTPTPTPTVTPTITPTPTPTVTLTPTPTLPPTPIACLDLSSTAEGSILERYQVVTFTCIGSGGVDNPIDHIEFRVQIDAGAWTPLGTVVATLMPDGTYQGSITYTVPSYGAYRFECRVCTTSYCTAWGQAE
jgi:hypothetical protein